MNYVFKILFWLICYKYNKGKCRSRESTEKVTKIIQETCNRENNKKFSEFCIYFKVHPAHFTDRLDVGYERSRIVRNDC